MKNIVIIKAEIESISPLNISDGEGLLIDNTGKAYMPATTIVGSFRAYLDSIHEDTKDLFGEDNKNIQSRVYVKDSFADNPRYERRPRVRINTELGSAQDKGKFEEIFFSKGLSFNLEFKIETDKDNNDKHDNEKDKMKIYKALKALNSSLIRIGGNKSNGSGVFKLVNVKEINYDLTKNKQWLKYLKRDELPADDIKEKILSIENPEDYVEFNLKGKLTTPLLIGAMESFDSEKVDSSSMLSSDEHIIPGSSFKGVLRSRIDKIGKLFNNNKIADEMFGEIKDYKNGENNFSSRVFVNEAIIEEGKESVYNRIQIDKFTGGVRKTGLFDDMPVQGSTEFKVIYRKQNNKIKDDYAIGVITLALRDLGNEDLSLGGGFSIGRGRFKASYMSIIDGVEEMNIDFDKEIFSNKEKLDKYIKSVRTFDEEVNYEE